MRSIPSVVLCVIACSLGGGLRAQDAASSADRAIVTVDPSTPLGPVNRRILGNNALAYLHVKPIYSAQGAGMWDPEGKRPVAEMVRLARAAGVSTLRWPGGCGAHRYDWTLTVGPAADRPKQPFGLPEFMQVCEAIGADPMMTIAVYWGKASNAADLVEYLNAPVGKNPNGGKDWAAVRAADGHPQPYGVTWFEYGNESYHGPHRGHREHGTPIDPKDYARNFREYRTQMRAVDPSIKLGAILKNHKTPVRDWWDDTVIARVGDVADFFIHHAYLPSYRKNDGGPPADELYRIAFAAPRQFDYFYEVLNRRILETTGRKVPLAITEFNGSFVQSKPVPYRLCLGTAVQVADLIRVLLDPRHRIDSAQYWQFSNEYWGMVKGYEAPYTLRPAYHMVKLYNDHLGERLLKTTVQCDGYDTDGGYRVLPAGGDRSEFTLVGEPEPVEPRWHVTQVGGAKAEVDAEGVLRVDITTDEELNYYHATIRDLAAAPRSGYRLLAEMRAEGLDKQGARIQIGDARGWTKTRSTACSEMVGGGEWVEVTADYVTLPDTKAVTITARRHEHSPDAGRFWVRNVRLQRFRPLNLGRVPYLSALATAGKEATAVFLINRRIDGPVPVRVVGVPGAAAQGWTLAGPRVDATNESDPNTVTVKALPVRVRAGGVEAILPPHSFSVVEVRR